MYPTTSPSHPTYLPHIHLQNTIQLKKNSIVFHDYEKAQNKKKIQKESTRQNIDCDAIRQPHNIFKVIKVKAAGHREEKKYICINVDTIARLLLMSLLPFMFYRLNVFFFSLSLGATSHKHFRIHGHKHRDNIFFYLCLSQGNIMFYRCQLKLLRPSQIHKSNLDTNS